LDAAAVRVRGLVARWPRAPSPALQGVDLEAGLGLTVLLGPAGAGKTTLLEVLLGRLVPEEGEAVVAGCDPVRAPLGVRARVGYAPQAVGLPAHLTLREYLEELLALDGVPARLRRRRADEVAASVHLAEVLGRRLGRMSGGMRRRALLAQALLRDPQVLLVDEPTAGLDPVEQVAVRELLRELSRRAAVLVATHFAADAEALPGQVAVLAAGRVVRRGTTAAFRREAEGRTWWVPAEAARVLDGVPGCVVLPSPRRGELRVVGTLPRSVRGEPAPPRLEDAYFLALLASGAGAGAR
jgi:ABC-2 type transport system ATP-binding protein